MKLYDKYLRERIEEVYIENHIIKDFDEMVDKIFSLVKRWQFEPDFEGIYAFEIIYNGLSEPIGVNPIEPGTLTKKDEATWIQHEDTPNIKRILYSTQVLILENMMFFARKNRNEKIDGLL